MKETNNNDLLTVKENEIIRLATPLKIVNYKAYDLDDNLIDCIETFSNLRYIVEPKKGIFSDDEILKYAANSKAAAKVRVKRGIADMYDFNLLYNKVPWKLALYYTLLISFASPIFIVGNIMFKLIWILLILIPFYNIRKILATKRSIEFKKPNAGKIKNPSQDINKDNPKYSSSISSLVKYEKQIIGLKKVFSIKEEKLKQLIEKRFAPPQITYDKFISTVDEAHELFYNEAREALEITNYANADTQEIKIELKNKIKFLKTIIKQIDDLTTELLVNLSSDEKSNEELKNLCEDIDDLIKSVKDYE